MFTQNCFVRNVDTLLGLNLVILGYKQAYHNFELNTSGNNLVAEYGTWHYTDSTNHPNCIDCGEDIFLFMFICNMRDDTDYNQLFVIDDYNGQEEMGQYAINSIQLCLKDKADDYFPNGTVYHRANVEDVKNYINYIKNK